MIGKVQIFHTETYTLHQAQAGAIEQAGHEMWCPCAMRQDLGDFLPCPYYRDTARSFGPFEPFEVGECLLEYMAI